MPGEAQGDGGGEAREVPLLRRARHRVKEVGGPCRVSERCSFGGLGTVDINIEVIATTNGGWSGDGDR